MLEIQETGIPQKKEHVYIDAWPCSYSFQSNLWYNLSSQSDNINFNRNPVFVPCTLKCLEKSASYAYKYLFYRQPQNSHDLCGIIFSQP